VEEDEVELPSLDLVRAEVDRLIADQERRSDGYDALAGLLVAFGGALVGLADNDGLLVVLAKVVSAVAVGAAMAALLVGVVRRPSPRRLRDGYLRRDARRTAAALLDSKIWLYEKDETQLDLKLARLRVGLACTVTGVALYLSNALLMSR
jgi:hypothetical protein